MGLRRKPAPSWPTPRPFPTGHARIRDLPALPAVSATATACPGRGGAGLVPFSFGRKLPSAPPPVERQPHPPVRGVVVLVGLEEQVLWVDGHREDEAAVEAADVDVLLVVVSRVDVRPADRGAE